MEHRALKILSFMDDRGILEDYINFNIVAIVSQWYIYH